MLISNAFTFFKHKRILEKAYLAERILPNLSALFGVKVKKDWVCRLYAVLNPNRMDRSEDSLNHIYEVTSTGSLSDAMYVEKWVMDRLNIASTFISENNLFELVTCSIDRIDESDNYLVVISPIAWEHLKRSAKRSAKIALTTILVLALALTVLSLIF